MPYNPPASNTQSGNGANLYLLASGSGGAGDVIDGNLTVTGNIIGNGSLTIAGASNLNGAVTAVSLSSPGAVSAATVSSSGAMSCASLSSPGVVSAGTLSSSGGVNGSTVTASGAVTGGSISGGTVSATTSVTGATINNSTPGANQVVQVVNNGVASNGASFGAGVILQMPLTSIFPQSVNYKSYKIFMSGDATDKYASISGVANGQGGAGQYFGQFQTSTGAYSAQRNLKGNLQSFPIQVPANPGGITMTPDSVDLVPGSLVSNTIFYCVVANNGATIAFNTNGCNVWLHFVGVL